MKKIGQLPFQQWLCDDEIKAIFTTLDNKALLVGGCVRDALLHRPVKDFDVATELRPEDVMRKLQAAGFKVLPLGIEFGTVTVILPRNKIKIEITTLRRDVKTDGRHAEVEFGTSWREDAQRRDFTINALYADIEGYVYDPLAVFEDISTGVVRFIGNPKQRIKEDALRILRFFRFQAYYGRQKPDMGAIAAIRELAFLVQPLSKERITEEFSKILQAPSADEIMLLMHKLKVLDFIDTNLTNLGALKQLVWLETTGIKSPYIQPSLERRLVTVLSGQRLNKESRLRLSNKEKQRMEKLEKEAQIIRSVEKKGVEKTVYLYGKQTVIDALLIHFAKERDNEMQISFAVDKKYLMLLKEIEEAPEHVFPITGKDLLKTGATEGKSLGQKIKELESKWLQANFGLTKTQLLEELKEKR